MVEKKIKYYKAASYYTIDEYGNIYNNRTNRYLKPTLDKHGYYQIKIYVDESNKKRASYLVHRLVATTFIPIDENEIYTGRYSNRYTVDHIDGNKTNNYYKNLRWIPFLNNCNEAKKLGYNNPDADYTDISEDIVLKVIDDLINLYSYEEIMERRGVSKNMVSRIRTKRRWKHLTKDIIFPTTRVHNRRDDVLTYVYYALNTDIPAKKLSRLLKDVGINIKDSQIYNIRNGTCCKSYIQYIKDGKFRPSTTILKAAA